MAHLSYSHQSFSSSFKLALPVLPLLTVSALSTIKCFAEEDSICSELTFMMHVKKDIQESSSTHLANEISEDEISR